MALKGRRQVGCLTSAERGVLTTACLCMSATGHYLPPFLIFPRVRLTEQLKKGAPPDTIFSCNGNGWMTITDFIKWFDHFLQHTRPSAENPVMLILDGHATHTKNLVVLEKAQKNYVTIISLPPHCSHRLQPLDVSYMSPLKSNFSTEIEAFLKNNPGRVVTINDIANLFGKAFLKTSSSFTAINGFKKTGIVPLNRFIFSEADFAPSQVSDSSMEIEVPTMSFEDQHDERDNACDTADKEYEDCKRLDESSLITNQSYQYAESKGNQSRDFDKSLVIDIKSEPKDNQSHGFDKPSVFDVTPDDILPVPRMQAKRISKNTKREKAANITSIEYVDSLKAAQASKDINLLQKDKRRSKQASETKKPRKQRTTQGKRSKLKKVEEVQDTLCDTCGQVFSDSDDGLKWNKCQSCLLWFHTSCQQECISCAL